MSLVRRFRRLYGAGPLHGLALVASFALAGAAAVGWFERSYDAGAVVVWFLAAILAHDVVLLPLYSLLDRIAFGRGASGRAAVGADAGVGPAVGAAGGSAPRGSDVGAAAFIRIPAILSGLLLLVFFPLIFGLGSATFHAASDTLPSGYLARWLGATGVLFAGSGVAYALAVRRARTSGRG